MFWTGLALLANTSTLRFYEHHSTRMGPVTRAFIIYVLGSLLCCKHCPCVTKRKKKQKQNSTVPTDFKRNGNNNATNNSEIGSDLVEVTEDPNYSKEAEQEDPLPDEDDVEAWNEEWKEGAKILDRFFLIFFTGATLATYLVLYIIYPTVITHY